MSWLSLLEDTTWQMRYGERYALEGVVSDLRPALSIEIGTAEGGSLRRIAAHSGEVHSFDIDPGVADVVAAVPNAVAHIGDSATTLPAFLSELEREGRTVDFVLIDGDHSAAGVKRDLEAVLASGACGHTVVLLHDTANDDVRAGLEALDLPSHPKVALCLLDFFAGRLVVKDHVYARQCWNGLGLLMLDAAREPGPPVVEVDHEDVPLTLRLAREALRATD
jgi:methyltransferase family protein